MSFSKSTTPRAASLSNDPSGCHFRRELRAEEMTPESVYRQLLEDEVGPDALAALLERYELICEQEGWPVC